MVFMGEIDVSVVMPCLNEEKSIVICVKKSLETLKKAGYKSEVVVSDNGSKDNSVKLAKEAGARVVNQPLRGYGNAYRKGFAEAKGDIIVMFDSDLTYPIEDIPRFVEPILKGEAEFVLGNRLKGKMEKGAMPPLHKYIGNPALTTILNILFGSHWGDAHCGMRAFTKNALQKMQLRTSGMEFASEMVINASRLKLKSKQITINYFSRKKDAPPSLHSFSDGWRHIRFMLLYTPLHLFLIPGIVLLFLGIVLLASSFLNLFSMSTSASYFSPMLGSLLSIIGFQGIMFALMTKTFAVEDKFIQTGMPNYARGFTFEEGLIVGFVLFATGVILGLYTLFFSNLHGADLVKIGIVASTIIIISIQTLFAAFFLSILGIKRDDEQK